MKTNIVLVSAAIVSMCGLAILQARTSGDNTGKALPELKVTFFKDGDAPVLAGKPLLVEFWATWCPPCRKSIPHLNEVYKKYKDKGLEIVGITDEDKPTVAAFVKDIPMDYPVALDEGGKFSAQFGIQGIPHALLVNRAGKIIWEGHPMSLKDSDIDNALKD